MVEHQTHNLDCAGSNLALGTKNYRGELVIMNLEVLKESFLREIVKIKCPLKISVEDNPISESFEVQVPIEYLSSWIKGDSNKLGEVIAKFFLNDLVELSCHGDLDSEDSFLATTSNMMHFCHASSFGIERKSVSFEQTIPLDKNTSAIAMSLRVKVGWVVT